MRVKKYGSGRGERFHPMPVRPLTVYTPHWKPPYGNPEENTLRIYITLFSKDLRTLARHLRRKITEEQTPDGISRYIKLKEGNLELTFQEEY